MKSHNFENVSLAKAKGVWSTPPQNEYKINQAFDQCSNVILIFSVKESGRFQVLSAMIEYQLACSVCSECHACGCATVMDGRWIREVGCGTVVR